MIKDDVIGFLTEFKTKMSIWDIIFRDDRGKNAQALLELEITPGNRKEFIEQLTYLDYCEGPKEDTLNHLSPLWIFGKTIKNKEIYIKITLGHESSHTICISFHIAEHELIFPLKTDQSQQNKKI